MLFTVLTRLFVACDWVCTVTVNEPVAVFPCESVAVQDTVVVPIANVEPEVGVQIGVTDPSTKSVAVAVYVTVAPEVLVADTVIGEGSASIGGVVSAVIALPQLGVASLAALFVSLVTPVPSEFMT